MFLRKTAIFLVQKWNKNKAKRKRICFTRFWWYLSLEMGLKGMKTDYKPSIPLFVDLKECFRQSLGTLPSKFWEFFENGDIWNDFGNKMDYGRIFEIFWEIFEKERGSIINLESTYPCLYIKFHPFEPKFDFRMDFRTFFHVKFSGKFTLFMTWFLERVDLILRPVIGILSFEEKF